MIRFGFEDCLGQPEAQVWLASWGRGEREFAELQRRWREILAATFE
jgi:hypothetical protein